MKKIRLKKWVKYTIYISFVIILGIMFAVAIKTNVDRVKKISKDCDKEKGYICSYYEIRTYKLGE